MPMPKKLFLNTMDGEQQKPQDKKPVTLKMGNYPAPFVPQSKQVEPVSVPGPVVPPKMQPKPKPLNLQPSSNYPTPFVKPEDEENVQPEN